MMCCICGDDGELMTVKNIKTNGHEEKIHGWTHEELMAVKKIHYN